MGSRSDRNVLVMGVRLPPETFLDRLFLGLQSRGIRLTIASKDPMDGRWGYLPINGFRGRWTWRTRWGSPRREWDLVYFPWNSSAVEFRKAFQWAPASIISCRGAQVNIAPYNPRRKEFVADMAETLRQATLVHCVSGAIQDRAVQLGASRDRCRIIFPAVDPEFFVPIPRMRSDGAIRVVMIGGPIWRKGYEYALMALHMVRSSGVQTRLDIVGSGSEMQRVRFTIADLGLEEVVTLHGALNPAAVRRLLQQGDVFLLTSLSEGISNGVLEGMACGLPVVTSDCGGMPEAVRDGIDGFVIPTRDVHAVADALKWLSTHERERLRMGGAARERILERFAIAEQIDRWLQLIDEAVTLAGSPS